MEYVKFNYNINNDNIIYTYIKQIFNNNENKSGDMFYFILFKGVRLCVIRKL